MGVNWIILGNDPSRFAICECIVRMVFESPASLRRYHSAQPLLSTANFLLLMPAGLCRLDGCMSVVNEVPFPIP